MDSKNMVAATLTTAHVKIKTGLELTFVNDKKPSIAYSANSTSGKLDEDIFKYVETVYKNYLKIVSEN